MRVIAGSRRSLPLQSVPGTDTRPTTDRIKETLFNMLAPDIPGCRFLDLFAGSGGIGIEALSRGASFCCFVEKNPKALRVIAANLDFTGFLEQSKVVRGDVLKVLAAGNPDEPYDLIFLDPPYAMGAEEETVRALCRNGWMRKNALIVVEAAVETDFSWTEKTDCEIIKNKQYKTNRHVFIRRITSEQR